jgi:lipopolysaccharide/colanic/teichoic acid biosynthesis glycosyltransferase
MGRRLFDLAVSATALATLCIPFALVAAVIALSSKGPVIYRQQRIGRFGRPFCLYKFRTMHVGSTGSQVTVTGDPRVYPVGAWLRRWKIDELPQFWNIFRGDMSVVGPRPEVERFVRRYSAEQRRVLEQKPGLGSLSQLVYPHEPELLEAATDPEAMYVSQLMPRKLAVDLQYEATRTFWSDLRLLAEIVLLVIGKSYRIDHSLNVGTRDAIRERTAQR